MTRRIDYRYDESGLDNVILKYLPLCTDDDGEEVVTIPNINLLHATLTVEVASKQTGLLPKEIRLLRTEIGMTQAQVAEMVGRDSQTVGRWERGETPIDQAAEMVLRIEALKSLQADVDSMTALAKKTVPSSGDRPYLIDASDPSHYRPIAA